MLQTLRRRLQGEREGGFTLIELMVVVLIIAILIAIAIPTFLGARTRAQDRAAQASLRNALVAAKSIYTDTQSYATAEGAGLTAVEPSLTYKAKGATSTGPNDVSADGTTTPAEAAAMFVMIGADPYTGWLGDAVRRDDRGYVLTGQDLLDDGRLPPGWPLRRLPLPMETSVPGVFAVGDVRHGSVKRVASAVGAGAIAVQFVHQYLAGSSWR